jgi:hypothetical protein
MDDDLPVPRVSLEALGTTSGGFTPTAKRLRSNPFPLSLLSLVKQGSAYSITSLLKVTEVRQFSLDESRDAVSQYYDLVGSRQIIDASNYIVWQVEQCMPITGGPLILSSSDLAGRPSAGISQGHLSASGYAKITDKRISIYGESLLLADVFRGCPKPRTVRINDHVSEMLACGSPNVLVTPKGYAYHAGIPTSEISHALAVSDSSNAAIDSTVDNEESDDDDHDSDSDGEHTTQKKPYDFNSIVCAMRLGSLMRNAANIKDAVKAALGLAAASLPHCSDETCIYIQLLYFLYPITNTLW